MKSLPGWPKNATLRKNSLLHSTCICNYRQFFTNQIIFQMPLNLPILISFQYVLPRGMNYGSFENGSWNGMIGMIVENVKELNSNYYNKVW